MFFVAFLHHIKIIYLYHVRYRVVGRPEGTLADESRVALEFAGDAVNLRRLQTFGK